MSRNPAQVLELLRDLLRIIEDYVNSVVDLEIHHQINASELGKALQGGEFLTLFTQIPQLDPQKQLLFLRAFGNIVSVLPAIANPNILPTEQKKQLSFKLNSVCRDIEAIVGVSKTATKPTDLDSELLEKCMNKNYHDTVSNAFPILEDKIRQKLNVSRDYHGSDLIDLAFNPGKGRLILGETNAEKEGIYFLFKGALMFIRNPPAHTQSGEEDRNSALKILHMVDFLIKMVDKAKLRPIER